jgi:hypothetical protein
MLWARLRGNLGYDILVRQELSASTLVGSGRTVGKSTPMPSHHILSSLSLATLVIVLLIAAMAFVYFIRRKSNRHPMEGRQERNIAKDMDSGRKPNDHSPRH